MGGTKSEKQKIQKKPKHIKLIQLALSASGAYATCEKTHTPMICSVPLLILRHLQYSMYEIDERHQMFYHIIT